MMFIAPSHVGILFDVKLENIFLMELNEDLLETEGWRNAS